MRVWAVIPAAGRGARLGHPKIAKALVPIAGVPMIVWSLRTLAKVPGVEGAAIAAPPGGEEEVRTAAADASLETAVVPGGETRQASVAAALAAVPEETETLIVHDAARPLASPELFERVIDALSGGQGVVCAVPVSDTLKRVGDGRVISSVDREGLWRAQTPQAFRPGALREASARAAREGFLGTDDAILLERLGIEVVVVPGDERNFKITTPDDLVAAESIITAGHGP